MSRAQGELSERAEDVMVSMRLPPSAQCLDRDGYLAFHLPNPNPLFGRVDRLRLASDAVEDAIADVRRWFASRGRDQFCWCIGRHARPIELAERLTAAGAVPAENPEIAVMVLEDEPPEGPPGVDVRPVVSLADFIAQRHIRLDAFEFTAEQRQASLARMETAYSEYLEETDVTVYLALVDGIPVAAAEVAFTTDRLGLRALLSLDTFRLEEVKAYEQMVGIESAPPVERVVVGEPIELGDGTKEVHLDIDVIRAVAPEASIISYEAPLTWDGFAAALRRQRRQPHVDRVRQLGRVHSSRRTRDHRHHGGRVASCRTSRQNRFRRQRRLGRVLMLAPWRRACRR